MTIQLAVHLYNMDPKNAEKYLDSEQISCQRPGMGMSMMALDDNREGVDAHDDVTTSVQIQSYLVKIL